MWIDSLKSSNQNIPLNADRERDGTLKLRIAVYFEGKGERTDLPNACYLVRRRKRFDECTEISVFKVHKALVSYIFMRR